MESINLYKKIVSHPHYQYCAETNSFNSIGYRSLAGNNYHFELRILEGIVIKAEIGIGYKYKFINQLQFFQIKTKNLIDSIDFHNQRYTLDFIIDLSVATLSKALMSDNNSSENLLETKETVPQVFQKVNTAFTMDQRTLAQNIITKEIES